jgi:hypothetical protein
VLVILQLRCTDGRVKVAVNAAATDGEECQMDTENLSQYLGVFSQQVFNTLLHRQVVTTNYHGNVIKSYW